MADSSRTTSGAMTEISDGDSLREAIRTRYASAARAVEHERPSSAEAALSDTDTGGCCGEPPGAAGCCGGGQKGVISRDLYSADEIEGLPSTALLASLGCGNPTALAELHPGEIVLDLGSGGGIDVLLSARRVGPTGFAYGLDMTDEMLALAERHAAEQGAGNVRFLKGTIEAIPLPDDTVDVLISNCVINLSADKAQVLREAYRVLKPGGRLAVSDVVVQGHLPDEVRRSTELWVGCVAGALEEDTYRALLASAGFEDIGVEVTRDYSAEKLGAGGSATAADALTSAQDGGGRVVSAFVRATKPAPR
jgi:arsenite methyltransferase